MKKWFFIASIILIGVISLGNFSPDESVENEIIAPAPEPVAQAEPPNYEISVNASAISPYSVEILIKTNIPLPVEVMAGISIKGQKPTDTYIGVSERIKLTEAEQTVTLNGESENLPAGEYLAEVTFYPRWGAEDGLKEAKEIKEEIIGTADVRLAGSGESKDQADRRNVAQKWVMENVSVGTAWNESQFVQRMGAFEKSTSTLNLHDAFYFPETDMTIIVSRVKKTVATWRLGKATQ